MTRFAMMFTLALSGCTSEIVHFDHPAPEPVNDTETLSSCNYRASARLSSPSSDGGLM